ncbi:MAG: hypothetical protein QOI03_2267 [Solirubrobacteraceae bacterium]|jgi:hypothetical protein|nr:hypothetical protein [Solirubrobacteraceae bacterium]
MARLLATVMLAAVLLPAAADAHARLPDHYLSAASVHASSRQAALARLGIHNMALRAVVIAERYWGATPCGGQIAVLANRRLLPGLDGTTDGWVTFDSSLGANNLEAPADTYTNCTISLAHWQWPTQTVMASDWPMFCLTVVHEMGHLLGQSHSLAPGSVMAAVFTDESRVPPICRAAGPASPGESRI